MNIPTIEFDSSFFDTYLKLISKSFENKNIVIAEFENKKKQLVYVLCDMTLDPTTNKIGLIPIAQMFMESPYDTLKLRSFSETPIVASLDENLFIKDNENSPDLN